MTTQLDAGGTLSTLFKVIQAEPAKLLTTVVLFQLPTILLNVVSALLGAAEQLQGMGPEPDPAFLVTALLLVFGTFFASVVLGFVSQASIVHMTIEQQAGGTVDVGSSVRLALQRLAPVIGASFLVGLATLAGLCLFCVPGVILSVLFSVTVPAVVVERLGPVEAMQRSSELTRGSRLNVFVVLLVVGLIGSAAQGVVFVTNLALTPLTPVLGKTTVALLNLVPGTLAGLVVGLLGSVMAGVVYVKLRELKDGAQVGDLASVFA